MQRRELQPAGTDKDSTAIAAEVAVVETDRRVMIRKLRGKYREALPSTQEFIAEKRAAGDRW